jgi:2-dehydro-3-deoxyphosphogluconate aldolase/(4S)-4-hydroxy-2-oxoglutarate aldolase
MTGIEAIMGLAPVIPVLVIDDVAHARPIAEALVAGGLRALEVTLRTPVALEAIREMAMVEGAIVGAGTVLNEADLEASLKADARFIVSPGLTERLSRAAIASEFFPAMAAGGIPALKALAAPFPQCRFCPTGGITQQTARDWLALDAVACVGGSWLVPSGKPDCKQITAAARNLAG